MIRLSILAVLCLTLEWCVAQPAQIIIIRHAEKPDDDRDQRLSLEGRERAMALAPYLTSTPELLTNGLPVALFASRPTPRDHGQRPLETLAPLAKEVKLVVQTPFYSRDYALLAQSVLSNPDYKGKTILICWTHEFIPQLAAALGIHPEPPKWKNSAFDRVFLITYQRGKATLHDLPQRLMFGDSKR
jgi:hypothetical protein